MKFLRDLFSMTSLFYFTKITFERGHKYFSKNRCSYCLLLRLTKVTPKSAQVVVRRGR